MMPIRLSSSATFEGPAIREHGRLLALQCLPRLIAGTELNEFDRLEPSGRIDPRKICSTLARWSNIAGLPPLQEWLAVLSDRVLRRHRSAGARSDLVGRRVQESDRLRDDAVGTLDRGGFSGQSEYF